MNILLKIILIIAILNIFSKSVQGGYPSYLGPPYNFLSSDTATGTFFTAIDEGNCGFGSLYGPKGPQTRYIAAVNTYFFNNTNQCGQCYELTINGKSLVVMVTDQCPDARWCDQPHSHFDLSEDSFDFLQNRASNPGTMSNLNFRKVPCHISSTIHVNIKDRSNENWTAFLLFNHTVGIDSVSILKQGRSSYEPLYRTSYNYWTQDQGAGTNYRLKITSILGETIITNPIPDCISDNIFDTGVQFTQIPNGVTIPPIQPTWNPTQQSTETPTEQPTQPPTQQPTQQPPKTNQPQPTYVPTRRPGSPRGRGRSYYPPSSN